MVVTTAGRVGMRDSSRSVEHCQLRGFPLGDTRKQNPGGGDVNVSQPVARFRNGFVDTCMTLSTPGRDGLAEPPLRGADAVRTALSDPSRTVVVMRPHTEIERKVAPFEVVSSYQPSGDQPTPISVRSASRRSAIGA